jgi:hypothetical protein
MFLAMGVPVASRQDSFPFLEEFDCGILVDDSRGFSTAVDRMRDRLAEMRGNALRCLQGIHHSFRAVCPSSPGDRANRRKTMTLCSLWPFGVCRLRFCER